MTLNEIFTGKSIKMPFESVLVKYTQISPITANLVLQISILPPRISAILELNSAKNMISCVRFEHVEHVLTRAFFVKYQAAGTGSIENETFFMFFHGIIEKKRNFVVQNNH